MAHIDDHMTENLRRLMCGSHCVQFGDVSVD